MAGSLLRLLPSPLAPTILWRITDHCSLHCHACESPAQQRGGHLQLPQAKQMLGALRSTFGVFSLSLTGGEPLNHPEITALAAACRATTPFVTLCTSGICSELPLPPLLKSLRELYISAPALYDKTFAEQTGGGIPAKYWEFVDKVLQQVPTSCRVTFLITLNRGNLQEIRPLISYLQMKTAAGQPCRIAIQPLAPAFFGLGSNAPALALTREDQHEVQALVSELLEQRRSWHLANSRTSLQLLHPHTQGPACAAGRKVLSLDQQGYLSRCFSYRPFAQLTEATRIDLSGLSTRPCRRGCHLLLCNQPRLQWPFPWR